jgi:integrase
MKHRTGHLFKRGNTFYLFWKVNGKVFSKALRDDNGKPITTKREAEDARTKLMAPFTVADETSALESIAGRLEGRKAEIAKLEDEKNPPLAIGKVWSEFLASPNRPDSGDSTLRQYEFQWQAFADWMAERHSDLLTLRDVSKEIAEDYASSLNHAKFSPSTYNKHLNLLTLVFRVLRHKAKLTSNPWESPKRGGYIQRKRLVTNSRRELTIDELRKICQAATGEMQTLLALGIYSGLRLGDCATLRWGEVDLPRGMIRRIPNKTARRNPKPVIIPIHPILRDMLLTTPSEKRAEYVLPEMAALYASSVCAVTDRVQNHLKKCGITLHKPGTGKDGKRAVIEVGFHSLRHTFVSLCRESNAPLSVVESIVGHSNPAMTRHYTHVGELAATNAVALLPDVTGDVINVLPPKSAISKNQYDVSGILKSMTIKNWKSKRAELLTLLTNEAN